MITGDELLIRAKRLDGKWEKGYYVKASRKWHTNGFHEDWIITSCVANGGWFSVIGRYAIDPDTICRYTGIDDLYEYDIFLINVLGVKFYGIVRIGEYEVGKNPDLPVLHKGVYIEWIGHPGNGVAELLKEYRLTVVGYVFDDLETV